MNLERVIFGFFIVLALTLNFGFFIGEIQNPDHHGIVELFLAVIANLIATGLKLGDRSQIGAVLLATSLVADLQLVAAAIVWAIAVHVTETGMTPTVMVSIVSLSGGALVANIISVTMVVAETLMLRR
jgi:Ca2+/H+ antiporter, TMEM165/GDT1 family